jgi:hypothetical protein
MIFLIEIRPLDENGLLFLIRHRFDFVVDLPPYLTHRALLMLQEREHISGSIPRNLLPYAIGLSELRLFFLTPHPLFEIISSNEFIIFGAGANKSKASG